jgi:putative transposase
MLVFQSPTNSIPGMELVFGLHVILYRYNILYRRIMSLRKNQLVDGEIYHIFTKSIEGFSIFNSPKDFSRMANLFYFYSFKNMPCKFSVYMKKEKEKENEKSFFSQNDKIIKIIAYCIMPTHIHLVLQQVETEGVSTFMNRVLLSYTKYFNLKYKRKGPLWESRFKNVLVLSDEQLLHLTRYVHLNPVTAFLVNTPLNWKFSSFNEYIDSNDSIKVCDFRDFLDINQQEYKKFVEDNTDYQRTLGKLKKLLLE